MGIFDFFKRDAQSTDTVTTTPIVDDVLLQALINDEPITREHALMIPAVSSAVDFISGTIASMPVKLYKYKQGKIEEQEKDIRVQLLNGDTGDTLDGYQLKKAMVEDYLLGKGGFCYIQKSRNDVTGLYYVKNIFIEILKNFKPIYKDYVICVEGNQYKKHEFIKLLRNTKDGSTSIGVVNEVSKALETAYNTMLYQLGLVKSGGNKKGFLLSERRLGQEEINALKNAWNNLYQNNAENVVVLNNGLKFQESSNNSVEMQMSENKKLLSEEINNIFHITPNDFWLTFKMAIYPIIKAFETALNKDLLLEKEKKNMFFEFDVKEIVKANLTERYNAYKTAKETGFLTLNEIRKQENMEYIEGLDVVNVGLGAVLYDVNTHTYYTPNTGTTADITGETTTGAIDEEEQAKDDEAIKHVLTDKILDTEYAEENTRFNPNHDSKTGRFGFGSGTGGSAGSSSSGGGSSDGGSSIKGSSGGSSKSSSDSSSDGKGSNGGSSSSGSSKEKKLEELKGELNKGLDSLNYDELNKLFNNTKDPDARENIMNKLQEKDPFRFGKEVMGIDMKPVDYKGSFDDAVKSVNEKNKDKDFITQTVYHGTNAKFDKFDYDHFGQSDKGDFGQGIYTTKNPNTAKKYGKDVKEVEIKYKNPLVLKNDDDVSKFNEKYGDEWGDAKNLYNSKQIAVSIMKMGYDAVVDDVYGQIVVYDLNNTNIKK